MGVLTAVQHQNGYFGNIGSFPPSKIIHTVAEYDGSTQCCISCTQLQGRYSDSERKKILRDWILFLECNPTAFHALHFNSHVPQSLFDAICHQENLIELRLKWGNYANLSRLTNIKNLQYLYLGSCPDIQDLTPIIESKNLIVLYMENFKRITDYSPLHKLDKLEQLVISGPILGSMTIQDIAFILDMPSLASVWFPDAVIAKRYTRDEREVFRTSNIQGIHRQQWWTL